MSQIDEVASLVGRIDGKWCAKEVLGHLIDSAANNHQRFVQSRLDASYEGPSYTQKERLAAEVYLKAPWARLVFALDCLL